MGQTSEAVETTQMHQTDQTGETVPWYCKDYDELANRAACIVADFLPGGRVLATNLVIEDFVIERDVTGQKMKAGTDPTIHGLVTGKWKGQDVIVFVVVRFRIESPQHFLDAVQEARECVWYWEFLVESEPYVIAGDYYAEKDFRKMNVSENRSRKVMIAIAGEKFADGISGRLWKAQEWFQVQSGSEMRLMVKPDFAPDAESLTVAFK